MYPESVVILRFSFSLRFFAIFGVSGSHIFTERKNEECHIVAHLSFLDREAARVKHPRGAIERNALPSQNANERNENAESQSDIIKGSYKQNCPDLHI